MITKHSLKVILDKFENFQMIFKKYHPPIIPQN